MISKDKKQELVTRLLRTREKANILQMNLLILGEAEEAAKVAKEGKTLERKIDQLLAKMMKDWTGNGQNLVVEIASLNKKLQRTISDVNKRTQTAQNVVKAIGLIDDAIGIATKFL